MIPAATTKTLPAKPMVDYSVTNPERPIAGFIDPSIREMAAMTSIQTRVASIYERNGFTPFRPRGVEYTQNLQKKGGVDAQIFGLTEARSGNITKLGLPFDHTVPLALFVAQNHSRMTFPYKRSDVGCVYRGETPGPGRYNEFVQADIDTVSRELTDRDDAEVIATIIQGLQETGLSSRFTVLVNHVDLAKTLLADQGVPLDSHAKALQIIDKLKPSNREAVVQELSENIPGFTTEKASSLLEYMEYSGDISKYEQVRRVDGSAKAALEHLKAVERNCASYGIPDRTLQLSTLLARGLNYYTGIVFETMVPGHEKLGSVASGGRYDGLVDGFATRETGLRGVGGSIGLTRLFDLIKTGNRFESRPQTTAEIFVAYRTLTEYPQAVQIADKLRQTGKKVELFTGNSVKIKKQLELADSKGIPTVVMVMNPAEIVVKAMSGGGHEGAKEPEADARQTTYKDVDGLMGHFLLE